MYANYPSWEAVFSLKQICCLSKTEITSLRIEWWRHSDSKQTHVRQHCQTYSMVLWTGSINKQSPGELVYGLCDSIGWTLRWDILLLLLGQYDSHCFNLDNWFPFCHPAHQQEKGGWESTVSPPPLFYSSLHFFFFPDMQHGSGDDAVRLSVSHSNALANTEISYQLLLLAIFCSEHL